jgi:uncharacterized protein YqjF (DUF2071 family)
MKQTWHDLLFAHWPLPPATLRPLVPPQLVLDTFENQCWIGVVPFHMSGIRARGLPPFPGLSRFPELNVRTYVTFGGKPGVYFFSLDAANLPAVWAARKFFHLPYFHAAMASQDRDGILHYSSSRHHSDAIFQAHYEPVSKVSAPVDGSHEHWLTERYCLYTVHNHHVHRCEIHHRPWPLQTAEAEITINTVAQADGVSLPSNRPLLHFSRRQDVLIWPLRRAE